MVLGQSAATAAMQAIAAGVPVQSIDYDALKEKLLADGQVLVWSGPVRQSAAAIDPKTVDGIVVDDEAASRLLAEIEGIESSQDAGALFRVRTY